MNPANILNVALYESKTLFRSWFFRIFAILTLLFLFGINSGMFGPHAGSRWTTRAIAANLPYINVLFVNVAQAIIAVFLASDFLKRDKKLDTTEVIYTRPITNGEYVVGKTVGILVLFVGLVIMALAMALIFNLIRKDVPIVWDAYLYYPLLITVPTLVFILGLSFFLMILFKSQAVTFLILLGYIILTLSYFQDKMHGMLDYMAFNIPMVYSDFIQFAEPDRIMLHRLAYLFLGTGFIFATIRFLNRLPQTGRWNILNLMGAIVFILAGTLSGYRYYSTFKTQSNQRQHYLELNNRYAPAASPDLLSSDLTISFKGRSMKARAEVTCRNPHAEKLDTLIFSLNPGLVLDTLSLGGDPVDFTRQAQIVKIIPEGGLLPGSEVHLTFHYSGVPDESLAYLDIPDEEMQTLKRIQVATVDKKPGIFDENFMVLVPEICWYPMAGVGFNLVNFLPRNIDFARYSLHVKHQPGLTAVAPGRATYGADGAEFQPEQDLNAYGLVVGPLEKRSVEIEGVDYNLYLKPDHDYFTPFFTEIADTVEALIKQAKDDYEIDELDLYYAFNRVSLVEVPIQFHAYERPYSQAVEYVLPEMILIPEKGAGLSTLDFERFKRAEDRRDRDRESQRTPREVEISMFSRLLQNTFFRSETNPRSMGPGGGDRGENLIAFNSGADYNRNPFCVFPFYYTYFTGISSGAYPVFNSMMEIYLKEGFEVSPRQGFEGGITDNEHANLALQDQSMVEIFAQWNTDLSAALINQTGSYVISALKNRVGMGDFDYFLYYYLEDHAFTEIPFEKFARDFQREFQVDIEPYVELINAGGELPQFLISDPEYIQTRDDIGDVYLVRFRVTNNGKRTGMLEATFRIMGQGGFGQGGGMSTETRLFEVDPGLTKEVQVVLYDRPMMMTVNTLISRNIPSSYNNFLRSAATIENAILEEYERIVPDPVQLTYEDEYVVDNEDDGFSFISVTKESKLKRYIDSRKKKEEGIWYGTLNPYWSPARWTPVAHSAYYGEIVRSALVTRRGDGSNIARWQTVLPEAGYYELYVYVPVMAMLQRPSGRQQGQGGDEGSGQGPGTGQGRMGPRLADQGTDYHYLVSSNEGSEEVTFVLDDPEAGWNRLGSFHFPADTAVVELSNQTGGRRVIADAVKWVRIR